MSDDILGPAYAYLCCLGAIIIVVVAGLVVLAFFLGGLTLK
mgnify:CR=1 FL=1